MCADRAWCKGVQYRQTDSGRCELWKDAIGQMKPSNGYDCYRKVETQEVEDPAVVTPDGDTPNTADLDPNNTVYLDKPDMTVKDVAEVLNWIKKEVTMVRNPFCWKESYTRGAGTLPGRVADCPDGFKNTGLTCGRPLHDINAPSKTPSCPSGYSNTGLTCYRGPHDISAPSKTPKCPSGWTNFGLTCTENLGTGDCKVHKAWKCDTFIIADKKDRMSCESGYFLNSITARCHKNCPSGYSNTGEFCHRVADTKKSGSMSCPSGYFLNKTTARCQKNCPLGYTNNGEFCHRPAVKGLDSMTCKAGEEKKGSRCYPEGGNLGSCFSNEENDGLLCYENCRDGYNGVGPVCWQTCDDSQVDCGAGCAKTSLECGMTVANQVMAPLVVAANIVTMGVADTAADATKTVMVGGKNVGYTSDLGYYALKAVNALQTIDTATNPTLITRVFGSRVGDTVETFKKVSELSLLAFETQETYRNNFVKEFAVQTSKEIEQELDSHFHPETARFIKKSWADMAMQEMAEARGWGIASNALAVASLFDPTGVVGVVEAYLKPVCGKNVPFPCTEYNLEGSVAC